MYVEKSTKKTYTNFKRNRPILEGYKNSSVK